MNGWPEGDVSRAQTVLRGSDGLGNEQVGSALWVRNPKFRPHVISCWSGVDSVAESSILFRPDFRLLA